MTPAAKQCKEAVLNAFDTITNVGVYNRRPIANSSRWSQHSWANGLDLHIRTIAEGDELNAWLDEHSEELGIRVLLWRHPHHWDVPWPRRHVHVDFWPKGIQTPPLTQLGKGYFKYSNGNIVRARIPKIPAEGEGVDDLAYLSDEAQQWYEAAYQDQKKNLKNNPTSPAWIWTLIDFFRKHPDLEDDNG